MIDISDAAFLEYAGYVLACWGVGWCAGMLFRAFQSVFEKIS